MNIEKELSQANNSALEYLAPKIKVVEMKARRRVCQQSPVTTGFSGMENEEGDW